MLRKFCFRFDSGRLNLCVFLLDVSLTVFFGRSGQIWSGQKTPANMVHREYNLDLLGPKLHRLSNTMYKQGAMLYRSHAIAIRFPVDGEPELLDPGRKRAWPLTLLQLDQSIKRAEGIYEVALLGVTAASSKRPGISLLLYMLCLCYHYVLLTSHSIW